jgi:hypothetical protein
MPEDEKQYLKASNGKKAKSSYGAFRPREMNEPLRALVKLFKDRDFNLLYQDYSLQELTDFFVVRAIAPGLAFLSEPKSSERIAEVPRKLKLSSSNAGEGQLNEVLFEI